MRKESKKTAPPAKSRSRLIRENLRASLIGFCAGAAIDAKGDKPAFKPKALAKHLSMVAAFSAAVYSWIGLMIAYSVSGSRMMGSWGYALAVLFLPLAALIALSQYLDRRRPPAAAVLTKRATMLAAGGALTSLAAAAGLVIVGQLWNALGASELADVRSQAAAERFAVDLPGASPSSERPQDNAVYWLSKAMDADRDYRVKTVRKDTGFDGKSEDEFARVFLAKLAGSGSSEKDWTLARKLVRLHRSELDLLGRAAACKTVDWQIAWATRPAWAINAPSYEGLAFLSRVATIRAALEARDGRTTEAARSIRQTLEVADDVSRTPMAISQMVAAALLRTALEAAPRVLAHVSVAEVSKDWDPFLDPDAWSAKFREAVQLEHFGFKSTFGEVGFSEAWNGRLSGGESLGDTSLWIYWPFFKMDLASYYKASIELNRALTLPFVQAKDAWRQAYEDFSKSVWILGAMTGEADWRRIYDRQQEAVTMAALARAAIAARAFKEKHERWPRSLAELEPAGAPPRFLDPYTGEELKLTKRGGRLVLYSVGPDGKDDGGATFDVDARVGDISWTL